MQMKEPWRKRNDADILAVGKACKAVYSDIPQAYMRERTFDSSGFSAEGAQISTFLHSQMKNKSVRRNVQEG